MRGPRHLLVLALAVLTAVGVLTTPAAAVATKKGVSVDNHPGVESVPMIRGAGAVNDIQLGRARSLGATLPGFDEPDMAGRADMSVEQALSPWPRLQATGMRLGTHAVAFGGDRAGGRPDRFMSGAAARGHRVDFIPLHWYGSDFSAAATGHLQSCVQAVHDRYREPIRLTEYGLIDFTGPQPRHPDQTRQSDFARRSTAVLDGLSYVERFAWFSLSTRTSPTGLYDGTTPNATGVAYRSVP